MSWLRQGSQNSLEKSKLMEDQQEWKEEVLDFMGLGFCMPREAWRLPPPNLFKRILPTPRPPRRCDGLRTATTPRLQEYRFFAGKHLQELRSRAST